MLFSALMVSFTKAPMGTADDSEVDSLVYKVVVNNAPPYRIIEQWGGNAGYIGAYIDTINEISIRTGLSLEFKNVPFARALSLMKTGKADMMLGPNWSVERADYMIYLNAAFPAEAKVFFLSPKVDDISRYSDLNGLSIGVLRSARYFDPFDNDASLRKDIINDYENGFKMLALNRIDAIIIPERQGKFLMRSLGYEFRKSSFRVPGQPSFVTISRDSKLLQHKDQIEKAMSDLNAEGYFERLMKVYLH